MKTNSPVVNGSNSTSKLPRWVLEMDRITVPHTVSVVIVSVADSLSFFIMIEKVLYFLEEVVCKTISDFFYELPQLSSDYGLRNKMSLVPYMVS